MLDYDRRREWPATTERLAATECSLQPYAIAANDPVNGAAPPGAAEKRGLTPSTPQRFARARERRGLVSWTVIPVAAAAGSPRSAWPCTPGRVSHMAEPA